mmetsp:Transcript_76841/g.222047  ORF Transcript_76841/g.222047 Transcript_76841/m.222047 type:complete len:195 (-) Transcript_76841:81-665(-)
MIGRQQYQASAADAHHKRVVSAECAKKFEKTVMCRYYPKCAKGSDCMYAHAESELRRRPNMTKTRMCVGYESGRCPLPASECQFAHGWRDLLDAEGRPAAEASPADKPRLNVPVPQAAAQTPTNSGTSTPVSFGSTGASTPRRTSPPPSATSTVSSGFALLAALAWDMSGSEERLGPNILGLDDELRVLARLRL